MIFPEITEDEKATLLFAMGMATGSASQSKQPRLVASFLRLMNKLMANDPNWKPYVVSDEDEKN